MTDSQLKLDLIKRMQKREEGRAFDLKVLELWAHAEKAGYPADKIKAFTFHLQFLTKKEDRENRKHVRLHRKPLYCGKNWHNALRLKDGDLVSMPGIARPIPPAWMAAEAKMERTVIN